MICALPFSGGVLESTQSPFDSENRIILSLSASVVRMNHTSFRGPDQASLDHDQSSVKFDFSFSS